MYRIRNFLFWRFTKQALQVRRTGNTLRVLRRNSSAEIRDVNISYSEHALRKFWITVIRIFVFRSVWRWGKRPKRSRWSPGAVVRGLRSSILLFSKSVHCEKFAELLWTHPTMNFDLSSNHIVSNHGEMVATIYLRSFWICIAIERLLTAGFWWKRLN